MLVAVIGGGEALITIKKLYASLLLFPYSLLLVGVLKLPARTIEILPVYADLSPVVSKKMIQPTSTPNSLPVKEKVANPIPISALVSEQSVKNGINPDLALCIVSHESQFDPTKIGDLTSKTGISVGLWQIHLWAHPDVTKTEALDPIFSTAWAMNQIKEGNVGIWSTYDEYCSSTKTYL